MSCRRSPSSWSHDSSEIRRCYVPHHIHSVSRNHPALLIIRRRNRLLTIYRSQLVSASNSLRAWRFPPRWRMLGVSLITWRNHWVRGGGGMTVLARLPSSHLTSSLMLRVENPLRNTVSPGYLPILSPEFILLQPAMYRHVLDAPTLSSAGYSFFGPRIMTLAFLKSVC
jgi:hypothetical protein